MGTNWDCMQDQPGQGTRDLAWGKGAELRSCGGHLSCPGAGRGWVSKLHPFLFLQLWDFNNAWFRKVLHTAITHKVHPTHVWTKTEILSLPLALNKEQVESHLDHWFQVRVQYQNAFDIFASSVVCRSYLPSLHFQFVSWLWEQSWQVWSQRGGTSPVKWRLVAGLRDDKVMSLAHRRCQEPLFYSQPAWGKHRDCQEKDRDSSTPVSPTPFHISGVNTPARRTCMQVHDRTWDWI